MTRRGSKQELLFPVRAFMPKPYEEGSIYDMLARFGDVLFRRSDFPESDPSLGSAHALARSSLGGNAQVGRPAH